MTEKLLGTVVGAGIVLALVTPPAILAVIVYVAWHFVHKVW